MTILMKNKKFIELTIDDLIIYKYKDKRIFKLDEIETAFIASGIYLKLYYRNKWYSYRVSNLGAEMRDKVLELVNIINKNKDGFWLYSTQYTPNVWLAVFWIVWSIFMTIIRVSDGDSFGYTYLIFLFIWTFLLIKTLYFQKSIYYSKKNSELFLRLNNGELTKHYTSEEFTIKKNDFNIKQYILKFNKYKVTAIDEITFPMEFSRELEELYNLKNNIKSDKSKCTI